MARWKLNEAHYLKGRLAGEDTPCEWEYKEADRITGREKRKRFVVPDYRDVDTFVCTEGSEKDGDFIMEGPPTPAMEPLDAEAREISAKHKSSWVHPIESLPATFTPETMAMMSQFAKMATPAVASDGPTKAEFDELKAQLALLIKQNTELVEAKAKAPARRI